MRTIKFVECQADMDKFRDKFREMLDAHEKYGCSDENPTDEGVFIAPDVDKEFADLPWLVLDSRGHQGYLEDFETLDGALSYATDGHTTSEKRHEWDVNGKFLDELSERCRWLKDEPGELREVGIGSERLKKAKEETMKEWEQDEKETFEAIRKKGRVGEAIDRFVTAMAEDDDPEELEAAFVDSVVHDAYGVHSVEFPVLGGEPCIRVVFRNEAGQTVHVDGILEGFNMLNWRRVCDRFAEVVLRFGRKSSEEFDWPTPDVRVEYRADADANDIITSVSLVWHTDYETWEALKDAMVSVKSVREAEKVIESQNRKEVVELCPNCDKEARLIIDAEKFDYKTKCPNCGETLLLCDACHQDGHDDHCDKCNKELKENNEGKEKIHLWCNGCEEDFDVLWNARTDGYLVHCPHCGTVQHLCDECKKAEDGEYHKCRYADDGKCARAK